MYTAIGQVTFYSSPCLKEVPQIHRRVALVFSNCLIVVESLAAGSFIKTGFDVECAVGTFIEGCSLV